VRTVVVLACVVAASCALVGCTPPSSSTCSPACATEPPACDDGCPAVATELCLDGVCTARADDAVDVVVDVNVDRGLAGVAALLLVVVDARVAGCADIDVVANVDTALAGNRFDVSGGSFHPDLPGGIVPAGDVVVAVDAVDDALAVLGHGCVAATAAGTSVDVLVDVAGL
jgi:hypothetical protein